ncbi:hypothetical protein QTP86_023329, partial [Hemibagrus guttatus]
TGESSSLLTEEQLQCSICLEVFTDPVTTPCGHNFCKSCITQSWDTSPQCNCPYCKEKFTMRPELKINIKLKEVADHFKNRSKETPESLEVLCDVCTGVKQKAVKSCLDCGVTFCTSHLEPHINVPKYKKHKLIKAVKNLEKYTCQKHERPLELFCRDDQMYLCQFCTEGEHKDHKVIPLEEESGQRQSHLGKTQSELQQMIQKRIKKIQEIKHSVEFSKRNTEKEKSDSVEVFTSLMRSIGRCQAELLKVMEEKQKAAEKQAEGLIKDLEQEIEELKKRDAELEQLSHTDDHLHLLQVYPSLRIAPHTKNWTEISINTELSVDALRTALSQLQKTLNEKLKETVSKELKKIQQYAVDVTLDPDTVNPFLMLSDEGKQVMFRQKEQNLPENPKRFRYYTMVLGKQGFFSGRFYYEVQVSGKTDWRLGVVREARDDPYVSIFLREKPQKLGVFVDYEDGLVSFYDVGARFHIYSFTEPHINVPKYKKHKLINAVKNLEKYTCQKHERPLELFCRDDQMYLCQFCTEGEHKDHKVIPLEEESGQRKSQLVKTQSELQQMIQKRLKKIQEINHSVELSKRNTEKEKSDSVEVFTSLIRSIESSQAELLEVMEEKQKAAEKQAEGLIKDLEQEIEELKKRDAELEQLSHTDDHLHLLQVYPSLRIAPHTKNWTEISVNTELSVDTLRTALSQLQETLNEKLKETASKELKKIQRYAVDVTLDPDTVNPFLMLSDEGKQVMFRQKEQNLPENPKRFRYYAMVLGKQGFFSGRFYYEVQVSGKTDWRLGVVRESVNRKSKIETFNPQDGLWTVALRNGNECQARDDPYVSIFLREKPQKVGVFVDYEDGLVSFYDVGARFHIYSFTVTGESSSLLTEEQLRCPVCLEVFTDPITTPCGHNFCKSCITQSWDTSPQCNCPYCKEKFTMRPELKINITLREVADHFKNRSKETPESLEVLCDVCTGVKQNAIKSCLDCGVTFCTSHLEPHINVPKYKKHKLIKAVKNLEKYTCQKHERPLELFCRDDQMYLCQFCTEGDHKDHKVIPLEEESGQRKVRDTDISVKYSHEEYKLIKILHLMENYFTILLDKSSRSLQSDSDSVEVFTSLIHSIERCQAGLLEVMEEKQKAAEKQAEGLIKDLEQEIEKLKKRDADLEQLSHTDDHLYFLQVSVPFSITQPQFTRYCASNWTEISINTELSVDALRTALPQLQKTLNEKLRETVDVVLDPDTASPFLILSDDGKQVTCGNAKQNLPDTPKRFTNYLIVLGKQRFSSGRFYFEVQVSGKTDWRLGVARESVYRKSKIETFKPQDGVWTLALRNGNENKACDDPYISLFLRENPEKVGVFVDYEEGLVSFYDVEARSHIYSFTGQSFTEKLYPYFSPCLNYGGKSSAPLIISTVLDKFPPQSSMR